LHPIVEDTCAVQYLVVFMLYCVKDAWYYAFL